MGKKTIFFLLEERHPRSFVMPRCYISNFRTQYILSFDGLAQNKTGANSLNTGVRVND